MKNILTKITVCAAVPLVVIISFSFAGNGIPFITPLLHGLGTGVGYLLKYSVEAIGYVIFILAYAYFFSLPVWYGAFTIKAKRMLTGSSKLDWLCGFATALAILPLLWVAYQDTPRIVRMIMFAIPASFMLWIYHTKYTDECVVELKKSIVPIFVVLIAFIMSAIFTVMPYSSSNTKYSMITYPEIIKMIDAGDKKAEEEFQVRVAEHSQKGGDDGQIAFILNANVGMDEVPQKGILKITRPGRDKPLIECKDGKMSLTYSLGLKSIVSPELINRFCRENAGQY